MCYRHLDTDNGVYLIYYAIEEWERRKFFDIYTVGNKVYERKLLYIIKKQYFSVVFHKPEFV